MNALLAVARREIPDFGARSLTYDDFLAVRRRQGIRVDVRPYLFDEYLSRRGPHPAITLNVGLGSLYTAFVGFHALAHWFCHPGDQEFYLGSPGGLEKTELEASTVGLLALAPRPHGPPWPRLARRLCRRPGDAALGAVPERVAGREGWVRDQEDDPAAVRRPARLFRRVKAALGASCDWRANVLPRWVRGKCRSR